MAALIRHLTEAQGSRRERGLVSNVGDTAFGYNFQILKLSFGLSTYSSYLYLGWQVLRK